MEKEDAEEASFHKMQGKPPSHSPPKQQPVIQQPQPQQSKRKTYSVPDLLGWALNGGNNNGSASILTRPTTPPPKKQPPPIPPSSSSTSSLNNLFERLNRSQSPPPPSAQAQHSFIHGRGEVERFNLIERFECLEESVNECRAELGEMKQTLSLIVNKLDTLFSALNVSTPSPSPTNFNTNNANNIREGPIIIKEDDPDNNTTTFFKVHRVLSADDCSCNSENNAHNNTTQHNDNSNNRTTKATFDRSPVKHIKKKNSKKRVTLAIDSSDTLSTPVINELLQAREFIQKTTSGSPTSDGKRETLIIKQQGEGSLRGTKKKTRKKVISVLELPSSQEDEEGMGGREREKEKERERGSESESEEENGREGVRVMKEEALTQMTRKWMQSKKEKEKEQRERPNFERPRSRNGRRASMEDLNFLEEFLWREESLRENSGGYSSTSREASVEGGSGSVCITLSPPSPMLPPASPRHKRSNSVPSPSSTITSAQFSNAEAGGGASNEVVEEGQERKEEDEEGKEKEEKEESERSKGKEKLTKEEEERLRRLRTQSERPLAVVVGLSRQPPKWTYGDSCCVCQKSFSTFLRRRHHCRNCGDACCDSCSVHTLPLPHYRVESPQRVCSNCYCILAASSAS